MLDAKNNLFMKTQYRFIEFIESDPKPKTRVWICKNRRQGARLGIVQWFGRWRRYGYEIGGVVFTEECLFDIINFLRQADQNHKDNIMIRNQKLFSKNET